MRGLTLSAIADSIRPAKKRAKPRKLKEWEEDDDDEDGEEDDDDEDDAPSEDEPASEDEGEIAVPVVEPGKKLVRAKPRPLATSVDPNAEPLEPKTTPTRTSRRQRGVAAESTSDE